MTPPPSQPGEFRYTVSIEFVLEMTVEAFDEDARSSFAAKLREIFAAEEVTLTVQGGSIRVLAELVVREVQAASDIEAALERMSAEELSADLGVTIEAQGSLGWQPTFVPYAPPLDMGVLLNLIAGGGWVCTGSAILFAWLRFRRYRKRKAAAALAIEIAAATKREEEEAAAMKEAAKKFAKAVQQALAAARAAEEAAVIEAAKAAKAAEEAALLEAAAAAKAAAEQRLREAERRLRWCRLARAAAQQARWESQGHGRWELQLRARAPTASSLPSTDATPMVARKRLARMAYMATPASPTGPERGPRRPATLRPTLPKPMILPRPGSVDSLSA